MTPHSIHYIATPDAAAECIGNDERTLAECYVILYSRATIRAPATAQCVFTKSIMWYSEGNVKSICYYLGRYDNAHSVAIVWALTQTHTHSLMLLLPWPPPYVVVAPLYPLGRVYKPHHMPTLLYKSVYRMPASQWWHSSQKDICLKRVHNLVAIPLIHLHKTEVMPKQRFGGFTNDDDNSVGDDELLAARHWWYDAVLCRFIPIPVGVPSSLDAHPCAVQIYL